MRPFSWHSSNSSSCSQSMSSQKVNIGHKSIEGRMLSRVLAFIATASLIHTAQGHGYLQWPPARQVVKGLGVTPPETGNGLGLGVPTNYSKLIAGVCGDPFEGMFDGIFPVSSLEFDPTWAVGVLDGGTLDITLTLAANYTGMHSFHIMPVTADGLPPTALASQTPSSRSTLEATGIPDSPLNPLVGDTQWFIRSAGGPHQWENYTAQFKLPAGIVGDDEKPVKAVLRWRWVVRKDCQLLCGWLPANSTRPCGPYPLITPQNCEAQPDPLYVFSNCADILVLPLPQVNTGSDSYAPDPPSNPPQPPPPSWPTSSYTAGSSDAPPAPPACLQDVNAFCAMKGYGTGIFPNPCDCVSFIVCESGFSGAFGEVKTCPEKTTFNMYTLQCDDSGRDTCGAGMTRRRLEQLNLWKF